MELFNLFCGLLGLIAVIYSVAFLISAVFCLPFWIKQYFGAGGYNKKLSVRGNLESVGRAGVVGNVTLLDKDFLILGICCLIFSYLFYMSLIEPFFLFLLYYFAFCFFTLVLYYGVHVPCAIYISLRYKKNFFQVLKSSQDGFFTKVYEGMLWGILILLTVFSVQSPEHFFKIVVPELMESVIWFYIFIFGFSFIVQFLQLICLVILKKIAKSDL